MTNLVLKVYWSQPATAVVAALDSAAEGLTQAEAQRRLREFGPNRLRDANGSGALSALVKQFASPLVLILLFAASVSLAIGEWLDASIILAIVAGSGLLGFARNTVPRGRCRNCASRCRSRPACCGMANRSRSRPRLWCRAMS